VVTIDISPVDIVSLKSILNGLEDALEDALRLVSFLSRRRIAWYEAEAIFLPGEDDPKQPPSTAIARRRRWLGYERETHKDVSLTDSLIKQKALQGGLFQHLLKNYESTPFKYAIYQTMLHLLASYESGYLESRLASTYTALETLVNVLGEHHGTNNLVRSSKFKRLRRKLRLVIQDEAEEEDQAKGIIKKVPELRRRAFLDQLLMLMTEYNLDAAQLWPPEADIPSELHNLLNRRHLLIHQGKPNYDFILFDLNRLQNLVELWLLKILDCPDTEINSFALGRLAPIRKR
jgi:hypothetical protein